MKMLLPMFNGKDELFWDGASNGIYIAILGYRFAGAKCTITCKDSSSFLCVDEGLWDCIWKLGCMPKIKHFIWRLINGAFPACDALWKRKCLANPVCNISSSEGFCYVSGLELFGLLDSWNGKLKDGV